MYILEGNIGAGKSTFLRLIGQHLPEITVAFEPLHNWESKISGQSLLTNFFQNPQRWAFTFETFAMICRVQEHLKDQEYPNRLRVIERSIYSGHYCFSINGYNNGYVDDTEWHMYNQWFNFLIPGKCRPPLGFIYLRVSPEIAFQRIKKRNRLAEKKITLAYLRQIHEYHEKFLIHKSGLLPELKDVPVLTLTCDEEFEDNPQELQNHLHAVKEFMNSTHYMHNQKPRDVSITL